MIYVDDTNVKIDDQWLHGLFKSIDITTEALIEEQDVEGSSRKPKQAVGYDDSKINLIIILEDSPTETKKQKLEIIQNLFRRSGQDKPIVHKLIRPVAALRGISNVVLKSMKTKEVNTNEAIEVTLELWSYEPVTITAGSYTSGSAAPVTTSNNTSDTINKRGVLTNNGQKRLASGFTNNARVFPM